ncbi:MAG: hypothetical protein ACI9R3_003306 [Verrucomicrobiales bacterium]|jgi:hypothetical protein
MRSFRFIAYVLIAVGVIDFAIAVHSEWTGTAVAPRRHGPGKVIRREDDLSHFQRTVAYTWIRGVCVFCGGLFILGVVRAGERMDPFSDQFGGNDAIDELAAILAEEEEKHPCETIPIVRTKSEGVNPQIFPTCERPTSRKIALSQHSRNEDGCSSCSCPSIVQRDI